MRLSTFIYEQMLSSSGLSKRLWNLSRKLLVKLMHDPACSLNIHDRILQLPLSHSLPIYLKRQPFYDSLLGRLSEYIFNKDGFLKCVDVGANIGDSIAALYKHDNDTFLTIEPNPKFNRYLNENWGREDNVTILNFICSSSSKTGTYEIKENSGSASIVSIESGMKMQTKSLDDIVDENTEFSDLNLLKTDTDGHDFEVIAGAKKVISQNLPTILLECDAFSNATYVEDCLETLSFLKNVGYVSFLLYDNYGYLMGKHCLNNLSHFKGLLLYQLVSKFCYFDILLMKEEDIVIFLNSEHSHFVDEIPNKAIQRMAMACVAFRGKVCGGGGFE